MSWKIITTSGISSLLILHDFENLENIILKYWYCDNGSKFEKNNNLKLNINLNKKLAVVLK